MTILFESLGGTPGTASGSGGVHLRPRPKGRAVALGFGGGAGSVRIPLRVTSAPRGGGGGELPAPALADGSAGLFVGVYGTGYDPSGLGGGVHVRPRVGGRRTIAAGDAAGRARIGLRVAGNQDAPPSPPLDFDLVTVLPTIDFFNIPRGQDYAGAIAAFRARGAAPTALTGLMSLHEQIDFGNALFVVWHALAQEGVKFGDEATLTFKAVQRVVDSLVMSGVATSELEAINIVIAAISARALSDIFARELLADGIEFGDQVAALMRYYSKVMDQVLAAGDADHVLHMGAIVSEQVRITAGLSSSAQFMELLQEGVPLSIRLNYEGDQHVAYVINTDTKAVTTYSQYPFNSFARIGGRYFGMTTDGIRELEGSNDDGRPINWRLRLAMTNLGRGVEKRMQSAYLGYCSNGALRLQVIVSDPKSGKKSAHFYKLDAQPAESPQEARLKIGQGLKTVYWAFGLEAIDGASFQADLLELYPIVLDTKMQGQNGGKK